MTDIKKILKDRGYTLTKDRTQDEAWFKGKGVELVVVISNGKYRLETHRGYQTSSYATSTKEHFIERLKYNL